MPSVSKPAATVVTPPVTPDIQPDSQASPAQAGGTHDGRQVSAGDAQSPVAPALAGHDPARPDSPTRTVAAASGETINRPGEMRQPNPRRASLLRRLAQYISHTRLGKLVARLAQRRGQGAADPARAGSGRPAASASPLEAPPGTPGTIQLKPDQIAMFRNGIEAGRQNFLAQIQGDGHSLEQVRNAFLSDDAGLRRATTGLAALGDPRLAPPPTAEAVPAWRGQLETLSGLARRVGEARFSASVPANFMQYGTSGESNPYHTTLLRDHPQLEPQVRAWVGEGLELAQQLAAAYQRPCPELGEPQAPFAEGKGELTALHQRVDDFVGGARGPTPSMEQALNQRLDEANREPGAEEFQGWTEAQLLERETARNLAFTEERGISADSTESAPEQEAPVGQYLGMLKELTNLVKGNNQPAAAQRTQEELEVGEVKFGDPEEFLSLQRETGRNLALAEEKGTLPHWAGQVKILDGLTALLRQNAVDLIPEPSGPDRRSAASKDSAPALEDIDPRARRLASETAAVMNELFSAYERASAGEQPSDDETLAGLVVRVEKLLTSVGWRA